VGEGTVLAQGVKCTLENDVRYDFTECKGKDRIANVHFYYPASNKCDMTVSDPLPMRMEGVRCNNLCTVNGTYLRMKAHKEVQPYMLCHKCPEDSIAIKGGFVLHP
jgi:hypothetical protein